MHICHASRHRSAQLSRRMCIAVAALAVGAIRTANAAISAPTTSATDATSSCLAREYLWASSALVLLLASCAAGYSVYSRQQRPLQQQRSRANKPWRSALIWAASASAAAWGCAGVALSADDDCARHFNGGDARWIVTLAAVVATASLVAALALLVAAIVAAVQASAPGKEAPPAIVCLRCSCCSVVMKRVLLLAPMALLAAVNAVSWRESVALMHEPLTQCHDLTAAPMFFGGAALLFATVVAAQLVSVYASRTGSIATATQSPRTASLTSRRRRRVIVFAALLILSIASIAWAVVGWLALVRSRASACAAADGPSLQSSELLQHSMVASIALLLLLGWTLLTLTLCCRLEDFIVVSSEHPSVDPAVLSPTLCRSPTHAGSATGVTADSGAVV